MKMDRNVREKDGKCAAKEKRRARGEKTALLPLIYQRLWSTKYVNVVILVFTHNKHLSFKQQQQQKHNGEKLKM